MDQKRNYELMFLLNNSRITPENQQGLTIVNDLIKKHGAESVRVDVWDERKLAYQIKDQKRGTYVLAHVHATPESVAGVTRDVNISEDLLRLQVTRHVGEFPPFRLSSEMDVLRPRREIEETGGRRRRDDDEGGGEGRGGGRGRWRSDREGDFGGRDDNG